MTSVRCSLCGKMTYKFFCGKCKKFVCEDCRSIPHNLCFDCLLVEQNKNYFKEDKAYIESVRT